MASVHPVGALMGYLMMLVPSAKPDMLAAALVAAAYLSRGWIALGIAAGAAYSCKMSALVFLLPLLAMRPKALMIVVLMALPWSAYSLYCLGNPIFPAGAGFFLTAGWSREMSDTWGLAGNWMVNPGGLVKAMLYACPMIPLALFTPSPWPVMIALGLALVLLPAEGRYLLPATAALAAMKPVMEARGRIILMVAGCVAVLWQGLHAVHAPLDLLGQVSRVLPRKVLTIGEARKWPHLMRGADCQGLNDPPIARDVVRASRDTEDIRKKLVRQRGYRTILANRSICGNWPREMAKFRWTDREVLLWSDFIRNHTVLAGVVGKGDTQSGELAVFLLDGKGKRPDKPDVPGLEGEIWLLARGLR